MIELLLFLATFVIFFFLPVQFHIYLNNENWENSVFFELSFLKGLIQRKKEIRIAETPTGTMRKEVKKQGNWFWFKKNNKQVKPVGRSAAETNKPNGIKEFFDRYRNFGVGMALLTYFLPAKYYKWLMVAGNLEKRGNFQRFQWSTRIGTGDAALTAIFSGMLWAVKTTVTGYLQTKYRFVKQPEVEVLSDFQNSGLKMAFDCIFRVKLGYIMIAAFIARFRHSWRKGGVGIE